MEYEFVVSFLTPQAVIGLKIKQVKMISVLFSTIPIRIK